MVCEASVLVALEVLVLKGRMIPRKHGFSELEVDMACWQDFFLSLTNAGGGNIIDRGERFLLRGGTWIAVAQWSESLEKEMATLSSILAKKIPWIEELVG